MQVREALRTRHYSLRTEHAYVQWIRRFILFHGTRHPAEMGKDEVSRLMSGVRRLQLVVMAIFAAIGPAVLLGGLLLGQIWTSEQRTRMKTRAADGQRSA